MTHQDHPAPATHIPIGPIAVSTITDAEHLLAVDLAGTRIHSAPVRAALNRSSLSPRASGSRLGAPRVSIFSAPYSQQAAKARSTLVAALDASQQARSFFKDSRPVSLSVESLENMGGFNAASTLECRSSTSSASAFRTPYEKKQAYGSQIAQDHPIALAPGTR